MIHELVVDNSYTPDKLRKLARKLAMTGGYEVKLKDGLSEEELGTLLEVYRSDSDRYPPGSAADRSSVSARVIRLVEERLSCLNQET